MENEILLWDGEVPGAREGGPRPCVRYFPAPIRRGDGCILMLPGGGYSDRCSVKEGDDFARLVNEWGLDAFVVEYRVAPDYFPLPLLDARRAVRYVRANAAKFGLDPEKIAVMGSSAGGHLAALVSTYTAPIAGEGTDALDGVDPIPNATVLCYPVIDIEPPYGHIRSGNNLLGKTGVERASVAPHRLVTEKTPPAFLWHTTGDTNVSVVNSLLYVTALAEHGVRAETHIYPDGRHGMALCRDNAYIGTWIGHLHAWLTLMGYLPEEN